jgi:hypothetical protein
MWCCCNAPDVGGAGKTGAAAKYSQRLPPQQPTLFRELEDFGPLKGLKGQFHNADSAGSGAVNGKEFLAMLNLVPNAFTARLLELYFDADANGCVSLVAFVIGMARFK